MAAPCLPRDGVLAGAEGASCLSLSWIVRRHRATIYATSSHAVVNRRCSSYLLHIRIGRREGSGRQTAVPRKHGAVGGAGRIGSPPHRCRRSCITHKTASASRGSLLHRRNGGGACGGRSVYVCGCGRYSVMPNNALELTVKHRGAPLRREAASCPAAQLGR